MTTMRMLPNGIYTNDVDQYAQAWESMGKKLEEIFTGYTFSACNPGFVLERRETTSENTYRVLDRVSLSVEAANILIEKFGG